MLAHRRAVVSCFIFGFLVIFILRVSVFPSQTENGQPDWPAFIRAALDTLLSTIIVTFVISVSLWWLKPPAERLPTAFEVFPRAISKKLKEVARDSEKWDYMGHTGRYVRNSIFPILIESSTSQGKHISIRMAILDPRDKNLCEIYANYRNSSRTGNRSENDWTVVDVQSELVVTTFKSLKIDQAADNRVKCEVRYRPFLSQFRFDGSTEQVMVTQEDQQEPAFQFFKGSRFFDHYQQEIEMIWGQSTTFNSSIFSQSIFSDIEKLKKEFEQLLSLGKDFEEIWVSAVDKYNRDKSPYA